MILADTSRRGDSPIRIDTARSDAGKLLKKEIRRACWSGWTRLVRDPISIGLGHAQDLLRDEAQDQLWRYGRDARQHGLAEVAFHMVFLGITHATVR